MTVERSGKLNKSYICQNILTNIAFCEIIIKTFRQVKTKLDDKVMGNSNPNNMITIKDVAKRAGVAISTVSRVLNDQDRVSQETRDKVKKAADELGYVKNSIAASMKTGSTKLIVVAVPDLINEYYTDVIRGVEQTAVKHGYYTIVFTTQESPEKEKELFEGKFGKIIDGAVIVPAHPDVDFLRKINKPVVVVDRYVPGCHLDAVMINNYKGARMLMQNLLDHGHRRIAIVNGPENFNVGKERGEAYRDALSENGIEISEEYIKSTTWYSEAGYEAMQELMDLEQPPTAVFAANNLLCIGCAEAAFNRGMKLGQDISLVGFDDSAFAEYIQPGITVVRRATSRMGVIGAEKLLDKLQNSRSPKYKERKVLLDVELIERGSVADV